MSDITTLNTLDFIVSIRHILFNGMSETIGYLDYLEWQGGIYHELDKGIWNYYSH